MYRIVPVKSPTWLLVLAPMLLIVAIPAISYAVLSIANSTPASQQTWQGNLSTFVLFVGAFSLLSEFIASAITYHAYRNGREIIFDDRLTIHYPWPLGSRSFDWSEIARVEAINESYVVRETTSWIPLPVVGIVPGADLILSIETYQERTMTVRKFRVVHVDGRNLAEIAGDTQLNFVIVRWLSRKTLHDLVRAMGGTITWRNDASQTLSLRGSRLSEMEWGFIRGQVVNIAGLEEIDLSYTGLGTAALTELEKFPSLRVVRTRGSKVPLSDAERLNAALSKRAASSKFEFLATG